MDKNYWGKNVNQCSQLLKRVRQDLWFTESEYTKNKVFAHFF